MLSETTSHSTKTLRDWTKLQNHFIKIHISLLHEQPKLKTKIQVETGGKSLYMKSLLLVILAIFMLAGCGTDKGNSIGTQQEPSDQDEDFVPGENDYRFR